MNEIAVIQNTEGTWCPGAIVLSRKTKGSLMAPLAIHSPFGAADTHY